MINVIKYIEGVCSAKVLEPICVHRFEKPVFLFADINYPAGDRILPV